MREMNAWMQSHHQWRNAMDRQMIFTFELNQRGWSRARTKNSVNGVRTDIELSWFNNINWYWSRFTIVNGASTRLCRTDHIVHAERCVSVLCGCVKSTWAATFELWTRIECGPRCVRCDATAASTGCENSPRHRWRMGRRYWWQTDAIDASMWIRWRMQFSTYVTMII